MHTNDCEAHKIEIFTKNDNLTLPSLIIFEIDIAKAVIEDPSKIPVASQAFNIKKLIEKSAIWER
jgi:hypothetical protein